MKRQVGSASPTKQSPRRQGKQDKTNLAQQHTIDSEEATAMGLVYPLWTIKETQYSNVEKLIDNGKHDKHDNGKQVAIDERVKRSLVVHDNQPVISSTAASPSCFGV